MTGPCPAPSLMSQSSLHHSRESAPACSSQLPAHFQAVSQLLDFAGAVPLPRMPFSCPLPPSAFTRMTLITPQESLQTSQLLSFSPNTASGAVLVSKPIDKKRSLKTRDMYSLTVLEARSVKSRYQQGPASSRPLEQNPCLPLPASGGSRPSWPPLACGSIPPICSVFTEHSLRLFSSYKITSDGLRARSNPV